MPGSKKDPTERSKVWAMGRANRQEARVRLQLPGEFNGSVGKKVRGSSDEGEMSNTCEGGGVGVRGVRGGRRRMRVQRMTGRLRWTRVCSLTAHGLQDRRKQKADWQSKYLTRCWTDVELRQDDKGREAEEAGFRRYTRRRSRRAGMRGLRFAMSQSNEAKYKTMKHLGLDWGWLVVLVS